MSCSKQPKTLNPGAAKNHDDTRQHIKEIRKKQKHFGLYYRATSPEVPNHFVGRSPGIKPGNLSRPTGDKPLVEISLFATSRTGHLGPSPKHYLPQEIACTEEVDLRACKTSPRQLNLFKLTVSPHDLAL